MLLQAFGKIYQTHDQYILQISNSHLINTYELPSHFQGPDKSILCNFMYCDMTNDSGGGNVLACSHSNDVSLNVL